MSSSIARALPPPERERLREELLRPPAEWTDRAHAAVEAGRRESGIGAYRCPACGSDLWRSATSPSADHLHDEPGVGCSALRCDRPEFRLVDRPEAR